MSPFTMVLLDFLTAVGEMLLYIGIWVAAWMLTERWRRP